MTTPQPPHLADRLLEWFVAPHLLESMLGDLHEEFACQVGRVGERRARWRYWLDVLGFIRPRTGRPFAFKRTPEHSNLNTTDMLQNYFKITWRHLLKDRQFTILNLIGLSTGFVCTLFICLWVIDEFSFDSFHEKDSRLYEVMIHEKRGNEIITSNSTGDRLGTALLKEIPEIEMAITTTPSFWFQKFSLSAGTTIISAEGNFVSNDYFNAFSYPLIYGNKNQVLANKNSIAISEKIALQLFHSADQAVGKIVEWKWQAFSGKCIVNGVFKNFPVNSTQQYDFLLSLDAWNQIIPPGDMAASISGPFNNFVVLKKGSDIHILDKKMTSLAKTNLNDSTSSLFLRKYSDGYLYGKYENGVQSGGRIMYVRLFALISLITLLIACINFMNLSTAKASMRIKEVSIKKVLGAGRSTLIFQFLSESFVMIFIALSIAVLLTSLLLPQFNTVTGKHLLLHFELKTILIVVAISIITGLLAGIYPAFYLSHFNPALTLKGSSSNSFGELLARKGLVVFQFTISIIFIISVLVIHRQIRYIQHKSPGYDKENILYFEMEGRVVEQSELFLSRLKLQPGVINASSIQRKIILPALLPGTGTGVRWEGKNTDNKVRFYRMPVNYDLIETLGIKIVAGRSFSRAYGSETTNIILNEAAIKAMNLRDPIGKTVMIGGKERRIAGVSKNFHFNSLHEEIQPFIFYLSPSETMLVMVKITAGQEKETINRLRKFYRAFNPGYSFNYQFLNQDYQAQYVSEKVIDKLVSYFAVLAVIISCLGLFGLVMFTAQQRTKEIGVRKVLGASVTSIVTLLSKEFIRLVLIAVVVASPIAWYVMHRWLQNFAYKIDIEWWVFGLAGLLAVGIALLTVSFQSIKAALMNPVKSLRSE